MMPKRSFRDPVTGVLKSVGFVATNQPGDVAQFEADTFDLKPGRWRWDDVAWVPYTPGPKPKDLRRIAIRDALRAASAPTATLPDIRAALAEILKDYE